MDILLLSIYLQLLDWIVKILLMVVVVGHSPLTVG